MEKMSLVFFIIIIVYLLYTFLKNRAREKEAVGEKKGIAERRNFFVEEKEKKEIVQAALAAVLAAVMGDTSFVIKRVYAIAAVDERQSSWRYAGRQEMMTKKNTLR